MATGSFYNYYRGKIDDADVNNNVSDGRGNTRKTTTNPGDLDQPAQPPLLS